MLKHVPYQNIEHMYDLDSIILHPSSSYANDTWLGCQLGEPYGFPDDHQQNAAMFQCHVNTGIYKMFFYSCIIVVFCRK